MSNNKLFQLWKVSDEEEYKLKLQGQQICELEQKLGGKSLMSWLGDGTTFTAPLRVMIMIIHGAMQRYHHNIKLQDVYAIYDRYVENGGSMVSLYSDVYIPLFQVSGFFPAEQTETVTETETVEE
jgi:hypothetical protein